MANGLNGGAGILLKGGVGLAASVVMVASAFGRGAPPKQYQIIPLWKHEKLGGRPTQANFNPKNLNQNRVIEHIKRPTITAFLPSRTANTRCAMVVCPGGGYVNEWVDWEGYKPALWLQAHGIAAFVLRYRLPHGGAATGKTPRPLLDAQRAIRIVRMNARRWHISPRKIGIMGFSAGGSLASLAGTRFDLGRRGAKNPVNRVSCRPNFMALLYPVITMRKSFTHPGSRMGLLGPHPSHAVVRKYSSELQVHRNTPPAFIAVARDDSLVPIKNSIDFYKALRRAGVSAELKIFPTGNHGFGLGRPGTQTVQWPGMFYKFLRHLGLVRR